MPHFVGREEEIAVIYRQLTGQDSRGVALIGMGGIGKTTPAIHPAHALHQHFADGVFWANATVADPLHIAQSWAQACDYDFRDLPDLESRAAALRNLLRWSSLMMSLTPRGYVPCCQAAGAAGS